MNKKELYQLIMQSFKGWQRNNAPLRAAALSFFIILPLPSLLLIILAIMELYYGPQQAFQELIRLIGLVAGPAIAGLFSQLLEGAGSPFASVWDSIIIVGFSIGGAIGTFAILRDTMDVIWEVKLPKVRKLTARIRNMIGPFILVSSLGLVVIIWSGIETTLLSLITLSLENQTLILISVIIAQILLSFGLATLLFAITYKVIPQVKVHWRDVGLASVIAGIAFTVTNYVFGIYIQIFTVTTVTGEAGALMIILLWIFILYQIELFGAEISKVYAQTSGTHSIQHLPEPVQKILKPIEEVGERFERATKGSIGESPGSVAEQSLETEETAQKINIEKRETEEKEKGVEIIQKTPQQKQEITETEQAEKGTVEISVKLKTPKKKQKSED